MKMSFASVNWKRQKCNSWFWILLAPSNNEKREKERTERCLFEEYVHSSFPRPFTQNLHSDVVYHPFIQLHSCLFVFFWSISVEKEAIFCVVFFSLSVSSWWRSVLNKKTKERNKEETLSFYLDVNIAWRECQNTSLMVDHLCSTRCSLLVWSFSQVYLSEAIRTPLIRNHQSLVVECTYQLQVRRSPDLSRTCGRSGHRLVSWTTPSTWTRYSHIH